MCLDIYTLGAFINKSLGILLFSFLQVNELCLNKKNKLMNCDWNNMSLSPILF
jgi:hypothetical protein